MKREEFSMNSLRGIRRIGGLLDIIKSRRSIRKFKDTPVPRDDVIKILEAGRWAPSATNSQPWRFVVVESKKTIQDVAEAVRNILDDIISRTRDEKVKRRLLAYRDSYYTLFENAPVTIAILMEPYRSATEAALKDAGTSEEEIMRMRPDPGLQSVAAAIQNMLLIAHALGYGACWMTGPVIAYQKIENILDAPQGLRLVALVPVGVSDESPHPRPRKALSEIVAFIE